MEAAIVSYAEGSVKTVLGKLGSLLAQEAVKLWGVRDDIQELKDELESMNSFIRKHARSNDLDEQVKTWIKQVREISYDIEDCIDEFMHHVGGPIEGGFLQYHRGIRLVRTLKSRYEIVSKIKNLKTRVRSVSERHSRYAHLVSTAEIGGSTSFYVDPRFPAFFPKQSEVAGIEDRTEKLIQLLMDENVLDLRVISLVGYGGLGKTTLAMTAYESSRVQSGHFQCRARISVSQKFNLNILLRDILKQVFPPPSKDQMTREGETNPLKNIENWNVNELVTKLKEHLEKKIYVVVVDDIWTQSAWDSIKCVFPNNKNGSRIIITTRIKYVADSCSSNSTHDYVYQIEPLSKKDSEDLFFLKVFRNSNGCPDDLKNVSEDILKKCGGMPLAIVSIAGLLSVKPNKSEQEWKKVYNSLGSEMETNSYLEEINKILSLSYNDLPYYLKTCFLYLSIFPEDYEINRNRLVRKWVAEGFVTGKRGLSEGQVAESYFDEFVNRNLIQIVAFSIDGRVKTCRVHDMVLEIIVSKSVEENFVSSVRDQYTIVPCDKIRRLSIQSSEQNFLNFGLYHTRSLSLFVDVDHLCKSISFSSLRVIRVLDLEHSGITDDHLNNVGELFLLKYLGLRGNRQLGKLPKKIYKLQHLEMLDIKGTWIKELPKKASNLRNLKHLVAYELGISRLNLENMRNLETLTGVNFGDKTPKLLENLKHLKKLDFNIHGIRKEDLLDSQLSPNLYSLKLCCFYGPVPNCIDSLHYLVKLTLTGLILTDIDMQKLGTLPKLLLLRLKYFKVTPNQENKIYFRKNLFKCMKLLRIAYSDVRVIFEEAAAPNLEKLTLVDCEMEPIIGMEHLLKLNGIRISYWRTRPSTFIDKMEVDAHAHPNHPIIIENDSRTAA